MKPGPRRRGSGAPREALLRIHEYNQLVAASGRSPRQHERIARAARLPLTGASLSLLGLVARHGPLAVGEVARRVGVAPSTASRQLRPLERHGFAVREAHSGDRRVARLRVTKAGLRALARARAVMLNDLDVALRGWSAPDRRRLVELLARLRADLLRARVDARGWAVAGHATPAGGGAAVQGGRRARSESGTPRASSGAIGSSGRKTRPRAVDHAAQPACSLA